MSTQDRVHDVELCQFCNVFSSTFAEYCVNCTSFAAAVQVKKSPTKLRKDCHPGYPCTVILFVSYQDLEESNLSRDVKTPAWNQAE